MTIGIYMITHIESGKKYIGKSVNIERRLIAHKHQNTAKTRSPEHTNRHLYNSVQKHGWSAFQTEVIETFNTIDEKLIAERELYWMDFYETCDRKKGFNLRRDSSTKMILHPETKILFSGRYGKKNPNFGNRWSDQMRENMSGIVKARHASGEIYGESWKRKQGERSRIFWANNPEKKEQMSNAVSIKNTKYIIKQFSKTGEFIAEWERVADIMASNPSFKRHNIYAACSGEKPSMYGFIWRKELINV
jgi:group I intron endonuclease